MFSRSYQEVYRWEYLTSYSDLTKQSCFQLEIASVLKGYMKFWALARIEQASALKEKKSAMAISCWQRAVMEPLRLRRNSSPSVWCVITPWRLP